MDKKQEIIRILTDLSGSRSMYDIYFDWIKCMAIAIQDALIVTEGREVKRVYDQREAEYERIVSQYEDHGDAFSDMFYLLVDAMGERLTDTLGEIYMESEMGNKSTGQFFTPFPVSQALARATVKDVDVDSDEPIRVHEPSCGGGGMIIAVARQLRDMGVNYQRRLRVVAQDLDWKAVYMCYVQLSLLGIKAIVVQGDTLTDPYRPGYPLERVWRTPNEAGLLAPWMGEMSDG